MSKLKTTKNKIKSKLEVIKKFNDEAKPFDENSFDLLLKDLPSSSDFIGKKVGDLTNSLKKKKEESGNMDKEKLIEIATDVENKSNKDLFVCVNELYDEHQKTKNLIIDLTRHLDSVENLYNTVNKEVQKRINK